jgi:hypothetical protein
MKNWEPIKNLPELYSFLFIPEPPFEVAADKDDPDKEESNVFSSNDIETANNDQSKIIIPSIVFLFLACGLCIGLAYLIASAQRKSDLAEINRKVEEVFHGKSAVTDYIYSGSNGELFDVYLDYLVEGISKEMDVVRTEKRILCYKPVVIDGEKYALYYEEKFKQWDLFKDLTQYYEAIMYSGFDILKILRNNSTYSITYSWSGDMAYKVPERTYHSGYSNQYYTSPGYYIPTYRPSVNGCYEATAKFLTVEREDMSYESGSYFKIESFSQIETKFFEIVQQYPKYTWRLGKIHMDMGNNYQGDEIENSKITDMTSAGDANVYTSQWIVWYKSFTNKYAIEDKQEIFYIYWLIYSVIGIVISSLVFFILKYYERITIMK